MSNDPYLSYDETQPQSAIIFPNPTTNTATLITDIPTGLLRISLENILGIELIEIENTY